MHVLLTQVASHRCNAISEYLSEGANVRSALKNIFSQFSWEIAPLGVEGGSFEPPYPLSQHRLASRRPRV